MLAYLNFNLWAEFSSDFVTDFNTTLLPQLRPAQNSPRLGNPCSLSKHVSPTCGTNKRFASVLSGHLVVFSAHYDPALTIGSSGQGPGKRVLGASSGYYALRAE